MYSKQQKYYLNQLGITPWQRRESNIESKLKQLAYNVAQCQQCALGQCRTHSAFSRGTLGSKLMIIGDAPDFNEDKQGQPFVGQAGQLLDKMLASIGLSEQDVYITHLIKCHPPECRNPKPDEIDSCSNYLMQQIELIKPKLILGMGEFVGQLLLDTTASLGAMRQQTHYYQKTPVRISYNPADLLRHGQDKRMTYQDLLQVRKMLDHIDA